MPNMNNTAIAAVAGAGATLVIIGGVIYAQLNNWFEPQPQGPGSGDEMPAEPTGPGSGDEMPVEPTGPGSGDELPYEPEGPGSGDELPYEPEGPGSGDELPYEPEGPGSGDELPPEPEGPGSGDELPYEPEGPGSGDEIDPNEPTGPGSGDEMPGPEPTGPGSGDTLSVIGSCNYIPFGSTCTDYVGSYWGTIKDAIKPCSNVGTWQEGIACPSDAGGGCHMNAGTAQEMIIWNYSYGGDPFGPDALQAVGSGCNMSPTGSWISGI